MPVIIQSRMCGGATAQQKGEASQLRTYVDDWNLPHVEAVSLRKRLNRIVHSGDKVPYQVYLGVEEPNIFANDPVAGTRHWGAKNLYDARAEAVITKAHTAKIISDPDVIASKQAGSNILTAGISAQANRVKDKARLKREQEEQLAREAFEASEEGLRLKKEAEDKERKKEEKKRKHQEEVELRKIVREKEEAEAKLKEEVEAKKPKVKVVAPQPAPAPVKEKEKAPAPVVVPTATVVPTTTVETKKEPKKKKEKAPASASASAVDDDSWMTEASAYNATQKVEVKAPYEEFTEEKRHALQLIDAMPSTERVRAGITCWDEEFPPTDKVFVWCDEYHTKGDIQKMGNRWINLFGQQKCKTLCKYVGRMLCDLTKYKNPREAIHYFNQLIHLNIGVLKDFTPDEITKLYTQRNVPDLDWSIIDGVIIPIAWALEESGSFIHGATEVYPFVEIKKADLKKKKK